VTICDLLKVLALCVQNDAILQPEAVVRVVEKYNQFFAHVSSDLSIAAITAFCASASVIAPPVISRDSACVRITALYCQIF
jgi:hypothetical protein